MLKATVRHNAICVKDTNDGISVWTPSDEAAEEINNAENPHEKAVQICKEQPARGTWSN